MDVVRASVIKGRCAKWLFNRLLKNYLRGHRSVKNSLLIFRCHSLGAVAASAQAALQRKISPELVMLFT